MECAHESLDHQKTDLGHIRSISITIIPTETTPLLLEGPSMNYQRVIDKIALLALILILLVGVATATCLLLREEFDEGHYKLIKKGDWSDVKTWSEMKKMDLPIKSVTLIELDSNTCDKFKSTIECLKDLQRVHMNEMNEVDILYNFIVDGKGVIYEGRGWKNSTSEAKKHINIAVLKGNSKDGEKAIGTALTKFFVQAVIKNKLVKCFTISAIPGTYLTDVASYIQKQIEVC